MLIRHCLILLLSLFTHSTLFAQDAYSEWDIGADSLLSWWRNGETLQADQLFKHWQQKAKSQDSLDLYFKVIGTAGKYWRKAGEPHKAARIYHAVLPKQLWRSPRSYSEKENHAWELVNSGYLHRQSLGQFHQAQQLYKAAADLFHEIGEADGVVARYVWLPLANLSTRLGDFQAAEAFLLKNIETSQLEKNANSSAMGYSDLGLLYQSWNKPHAAQTAYEQGLALSSISPQNRAILHLNLSRLLQDGHSYQATAQQLRLAENSIRQAAKLTPHDRRIQNLYHTLYHQQAELHTAQSHYPAALNALEQAYTHLAQYYGTTQRREFGKHYNQVALVYRLQGQYAKAIEQAQQALAAVIYTFEPTGDHFQLPAGTDIYAENTIEEALEELARNFTAWHEQSGEQAHLEQALLCYEKSYLVDQALRRSYLYESSKLYNLEDSRRRAEAAISLAHKLYQLTGNESYLFQALVFAERDRSHLLREAYRGTRATALAGVSAAVQEQEQALQYLVRQAEETLFHHQSGSENDSLILLAEQSLLHTRDSLHQFLQQLEHDNPRYYQLKYADDTPSLATLQAMLAPGQLLVEFFVGENQLYVFTLTKHEPLQLQQLPLPQQLDTRVMEWRRSIEDYQNPQVDRAALLTTYRKEGYELYQDLLAPVLADRQAASLLLIPSGVLDLLPFEALLSSVMDAQADLRTYPYLLQDYSCSYGYSASLLYTLSQLPRQGTGWAGFNPTFDGQQGWQSLYCSSQTLADLAWSGERQMYQDTAANQANFFEHAGRFRVLHLATHAQANAERGDFSFIVFSNGRGAYDSLFAQSLYHLDLPTELVVLAACETALGTLYQSEGVISLARAFHHAGARSVLTTLWQVNEGANCRLMPAFYTQLNAGSDKASALHAAKLAYLSKADERSAHPVYWAGYHILGNTRPVQTPRRLPWPLIAGGLGTFLLLIARAWWRGRQPASQKSYLKMA